MSGPRHSRFNAQEAWERHLRGLPPHENPRGPATMLGYVLWLATIAGAFLVGWLARGLHL